MRFTKLLTNLILENSRFQVLYDKMVKAAPGREGDARKPSIIGLAWPFKA